MSSSTTQYGFYYNQARCTGCMTCTMACEVWNELVPGQPTKWARVFKWYTGSFPDLQSNVLFAPCYHCENPVCVAAANGAMMKEPKYGAVLIDPSQASSPNLKAAWEACPYGAIAFDNDAPDSNASKCTMCIDRLEQNLLPACVAACPERALDFGTISALQTKYGTNAQLAGMPAPTTTTPAVVFKPTDPTTLLVPYDSTEALSLMGTNPDGVTTIYTSSSAVAGVPTSIYRSSLNLKASSVEDFTWNTACDGD